MGRVHWSAAQWHLVWILLASFNVARGQGYFVDPPEALPPNAATADTVSASQFRLSPGGTLWLIRDGDRRPVYEPGPIVLAEVVEARPWPASRSGESEAVGSCSRARGFNSVLTLRITEQLAGDEVVPTEVDVLSSAGLIEKRGRLMKTISMTTGHAGELLLPPVMIVAQLMLRPWSHSDEIPKSFPGDLPWLYRAVPVMRAQSGELVLVELQDNIDELSARMEASADGSAEWDWDTIYSLARCEIESHGESPAQHEIEALLDEYNADKRLYEMARRMKEAGLVEHLPPLVLPNAYKHEE